MKKKLLILFMMCMVGWLHPATAQTTFNFDSYSAGTTVESIDGWRSVTGNGNTAPLWQISPDVSSLPPTLLNGIYGNMYKGVDNTSALVSMSIDYMQYYKNLNEGTNYTYSFTVNNYFVTEDKYDITSESSISWYVKRAHGSQTENYKVVVSEDGNTWTDVFFEDVSSGEMVNKTVSLEEYAGKELYLGFRHYRPTVNYSASALVIDNITISATPVGGSEPEPQPLSVTVSAAKEDIYSDETTTLEAEATGGTGNYNYSWTPTTGLNDPNSATPTFTPASTGIYNFTCTVNDGETTKQGSVTVNVTERPVNPYAGKQYRVRVNSSPSTYSYNYNGWYLHVNNHDAPNNNPNVGIVSSLQESDNQIFTIEANGSGQYYLKTADGYYIKCATGNQWWCVYAYSKTEKTPLVLEYLSNGVEFYIKDYDKMMGNGGTDAGLTTNNYFKVENSSIYCDASPGKDDNGGYVCTWVLEEYVAPTLSAVSISAEKSSIYTDETVSITATTTGGTTPFTYNWSATSGTISGNGQTVTFIPSSVGTSYISCSVTDAKSVTVVSNTVTITVEDAANKPKGEVGIDATNYSEIPGYNFYNYSISQQIYTKDELNIPAGSYINSISFRLHGKSQDARNWSVYLLNTDKEYFTSYSDFVSVTTDALFTGDVTFGENDNWFRIDFTKDFVYEGNNILVCITDNKGSYNYGDWSNTYYGITTEVVTAILNYNDDNGYNVANPTIGNYYKYENFKNSVKFGYAAPELTLELTANNVMCDNTTTQFTATASRGSGSYKYKWSTNDATTSPLGCLNDIDSDTPIFTPEPNTESAHSYAYICTVTDSESNNTVTETLYVTVFDYIEIEPLSVFVDYAEGGASATLDLSSMAIPTYANVNFSPYGYIDYGTAVYENGTIKSYIANNITEDITFNMTVDAGGYCSNTVEISIVVNGKPETITVDESPIATDYDTYSYCNNNCNRFPIGNNTENSLTQQIYTADELAGIEPKSTIKSIAFKACQLSNPDPREIEVYLLNTNKTYFEDKSDFVSIPTANLCYEGDVTFTLNDWTTIKLDTPFEYEGGNVIVCVNDKTGVGATDYFCYYATSEERSIGKFNYTAGAYYVAPDFNTSTEVAYEEAYNGSTYNENSVNSQIQFTYTPYAGDATLSAEIIADKTSLCDGDNSNQFTLTAKKIENATYAWYYGDSGLPFSEDREAYYSNENPGTYTIRLEVTQGGNMKSTTIDLTINEMPNVEFVAPNAHVGQTIEFALQNPTEGANYTLVIYNASDEPVSSELTPNNGVFTWSTDSYGTYHAKVTADNGGCEATSTKYFAVYIAASFGYEGTRCPDNAITFTAAQIAGVTNTYSWTIRNQQAEIVEQISNSGNYSFEHTFNTAGVYEVELTNKTWPLGKEPTSSTFTDQITIGPVPEVTDITTEDATIVSVPITFVAEGENIENTVWYIGVEEITMPYTFETAGDYDVSVAVSSEAGCSDTFVKTITIADKLSGPKVSYRGEEIREAEGDVVDMSYRPAGAWMAPAEVVIEPDGSTPLMINSVEIVGDYFDFDGLILENFIKIVNETVVDKAVNPGDKLVVKLSHDKANEVYQTILDGAVGPENVIILEDGDYAPQLKITYSGGQERFVPIDYIAYAPDVADVFETAPVAENGTTYNVYNILPNYQLDGANDTDYDAVYKIELEEGDDLAVSVTTTGADPHIYIYKANFNGEEGPGKTNYISSTAASAMSEILESGEYYVVVSSSDSEFDVTINANQLEAPAQASNPAPHDRANVSLETAALTFTLADFSTEYQVLFGTDKNDMTALVNWTATATNAISIEMPALERNNVYYWKVNARNAAGTTEGELWYFATPFDGPVASIDKEEIMATTESALLSWTELVPTVKEYNIYADETKLHTITDAETLAYTLSNLPYNSEEYEIFVQVVFANDDLRITANSNKVTLRVSGKGGVYGYVYAEDGEPVANATVVFKGIEFKTNSDGYYEGEVWAGVYDAFVTGDNCKKKTQSVDVAYAGNTEINFILQYVLSMVKDVVATETVIDESVDVEWSYEIEPATVFDFENGELGSDIASFIEIYTYNDNTKESIYESTDYETPAYLIVEDANAPSGNHYIASNIQGQDNKSACLTVVAALACDGTVSFYSKKLSDTYDYAHFYIDGVEQVYYPESDWIKSEYPIQAGTHTLKWSYAKDYSNSTNPDALYIDNITISSNISYVGNIYVKDALTENAEPKLVKENIAVEDYIYTDSEWWATADDGIYKYGVSVEYNEDAIDLINEDFTSLQYWTTYDDNTEDNYWFAWHLGTEENNMQALSGNSVFAHGAEAEPASHFRYYLVSRKINASKQSNLTFSYIAPYWDAEHEDWFNRFRVLYGTSETGPWTPLMDYNEAAVNSWAEVTLELPLMDNIYIAFESYNIYEPANNIYTGRGVGLDNVVVTAAERKGESNIAWSNMVAKGNQFFQDGDWDVDGNWSRGEAPGNNSLAIISAEAQLTSDETIKMLFINEGEGKSLEIAANGALTLTSSEVYNEDGAESLVINAGGQLVHNKEGVEATFVKSIQAYSGAEILDGWYTISSPLATNIDATEVTNMLSGEYDLYRYDEPTHYWENYEDVNDEEPGDPDNEDWGKNGGVIEKGRGYLYANSAAKELSFVGELNTAQVSRTLSAQADALRGFNLLGNPFAHDIYKGAAFDKENELRTGYYTLNYHGAWQPATDDKAIKSGAGFLVQTDADQTINIDKVNTAVRRATNAMMAISVVNNQYEDVTYVSFKDGKGLEKIGHMNEYIPVVYVPYDFSAYAIATMSEDVTEIPVNFEAKTMGEYTFGVKTENCEYKVMTLVDNFTGKETNLLSDNYTFWATTTDEPNRFLIKLSKEDAQIEDSFIYIYNDELIFDNLSGDAIINVFDVLGRNVATFNNCGETTYRVSTDLFADGVYLVRLIEGNNVKVQKMVIE